MNRGISRVGFLAFAVVVSVPAADPPGGAVTVLRGVRGLRAVTADAQASVFLKPGAHRLFVPVGDRTGTPRPAGSVIEAQV